MPDAHCQSKWEQRRNLFVWLGIFSVLLATVLAAIEWRTIHQVEIYTGQTRYQYRIGSLVMKSTQPEFSEYLRPIPSNHTRWIDTQGRSPFFGRIVGNHQYSSALTAHIHFANTALDIEQRLKLFISDNEYDRAREKLAEFFLEVGKLDISISPDGTAIVAKAFYDEAYPSRQLWP